MQAKKVELPARAQGQSLGSDEDARVKRRIRWSQHSSVRIMDMRVENRMLYAVALAAILLSLINECDKESLRLTERQRAEAQLKDWEREGGALR